MATPSRQIESLAGLFRVLGDPTRLQILLLLADGERNVSELCREIGAPQPTVSHHLGLLRMGELVKTRRNGKEIFYSLRNAERDKSSRALQAVLGGASSIRLGPLMIGKADSHAGRSSAGAG